MRRVPIVSPNQRTTLIVVLDDQLTSFTTMFPAIFDCRFLSLTGPVETICSTVYTFCAIYHDSAPAKLPTRTRSGGFGAEAGE